MTRSTWLTLRPGKWLQACAPPEASALTRLAAAMDIARRHPATIIAGDVVDVLPRVLAGIPPQQRITVVDAYTAVFLPSQRQAELASLLAQAGRRRPVTWLSLDPLIPLGPARRESVQGLPLPPALIRDYQHGGTFAVLGSRTFDGTSDHSRLLARAHPSGQWIEWRSPRPPASLPARPDAVRPQDGTAEPGSRSCGERVCTAQTDTAAGS